MASRFLITNRQIDHEVILKESDTNASVDDLSREKIARKGLEEARLRTRYGRIREDVDLQGFAGDPNDLITLYPHRENDDADFSSLHDLRFGSKAMFSELHQAMSAEAGGDLLIYVHGYNCDLDKAVRNLGLIESQYAQANSPVRHLLLFTWPAQGKKLKYRNDMRDTEESGQALARNILKLQIFLETYFEEGGQKPCNRKIHIMAHSSGARVLKYAMDYLRNGSHGMAVRSIFHEAILAAADVDDHEVQTHHSLGYLCQISNRLHNYNNKGDLALFISKTTKNAHRRLGHKGVPEFSNLPSNLVMVDVTGVKEETSGFDDLVNHWYYYTAPDVVNDILAVLKGEPAVDIVKRADSKRREWPGKSHLNLYWLGEQESAA